MSSTLISQPATAPARRADTLNVFITGASSGIGMALAQHYAGLGATLGLVARRAEPLLAFRDQYAGACETYAVDVRDADALAQAATDFISKHGVPDIVIGNAGVSRGTLTAIKEDSTAFAAVMAINVQGLVHTFQPFINAMQQRGQGQLVGIASVAGIRGLPGAGAYSASKAAAIAYLESLRIEMLPHGIAVTTIAPGYIRTPMTDINTYPMPFLMDVDVAASKFAQAIAARKRFVVIPWQMGWVARLLRILPCWLWDGLMRRAPHKARIDVE
ncbi:SDR family oxidoreductase [Methylovorus glucosotrophus]|uniref:SDR family oxidoreductase n=1 Tax=Methylovorus glucosotrophus TaxID=266009 RepID=UPI00133133A5|nr:SDR family oxidoreductase [Methylovorus glucosotrophus]